ncbi:DUF3871 family protein [Flavobacterium sp. JP2137]|uniref:DUF3871 family protein n=1 Tax=Flavobacterium sp. JP2137 TaxID=3414510 RepID=UPI003D30069F
MDKQIITERFIPRMEFINDKEIRTESSNPYTLRKAIPDNSVSVAAVEKDIEVNNSIVLASSINSIVVAPRFTQKPFIEANTEQVELIELRNDCIIPVFSKDNEKTIAHQEFIDIVLQCVNKVFPFQQCIFR